MNKLTVIPTLAVAAMLALTACGNSEADAPDGPAVFACDKYHDLSQDFNDGVLTDKEIRDQVKQIRDDAQRSDNPKLKNHTTKMLQAATNGDDDALVTAANKVAKVCDKVNA